MLVGIERRLQMWNYDYDSIGHGSGTSGGETNGNEMRHHMFPNMRVNSIFMVIRKRIREDMLILVKLQASGGCGRRQDGRVPILPRVLLKRCTSCYACVDNNRCRAVSL